MKRTISAVEARQNLGDVLSGVHYRNDEVVIERAGKPVAVLVPVKVYEGVLRRRERLYELIEKAHEGHSDVSAEEAERIAIEAVREYRQELDAKQARHRAS
jgi:prevent-host-death family protein